MCRKFIQMGRTRSLRYALRPGGKKYEKDENGNKVEIPRTVEVHDEGKMAGARVYQDYEERIWSDKTYRRLWAKFGGKEVEFKRTIRDDTEERDYGSDQGDEEAEGADPIDTEDSKDEEGEEQRPPAKKRKGKEGRAAKTTTKTQATPAKGKAAPTKSKAITARGETAPAKKAAPAAKLKAPAAKAKSATPKGRASAAKATVTKKENAPEKSTNLRRSKRKSTS